MATPKLLGGPLPTELGPRWHEAGRPDVRGEAAAFELSLREFVGQGLPAVDEVGKKGASK